MQTQTTVEPIQSHKVYHPDSGWRAFQVMTLGLITLLSIFSMILSRVQLTQRGLFWPFIIGVISFGTLVYIYWVKSCFLVISPEGIEFHKLSFAIFTKWDNIKGIRKHTTVWTRPVKETSLILHQPAMRLKGSLLWPAFMRRAIPLTEFIPMSSELGESKVEQDLKQYVPHLFAKATTNTAGQGKLVHPRYRA